MEQAEDKEVKEEHEDQVEAVKIAGDWAKNLVFLAVGTIVISLSFLKDFLPGMPLSFGWRVCLVASWSSLLISAILGSLALGVPLTGVNQKGWRLRLTDETRRISFWQLIFFYPGIGGILTFAAFHLPR